MGFAASFKPSEAHAFQLEIYTTEFAFSQKRLEYFNWNIKRNLIWNYSMHGEKYEKFMNNALQF